MCDLKKKFSINKFLNEITIIEYRLLKTVGYESQKIFFLNVILTVSSSREKFSFFDRNFFFQITHTIKWYELFYCDKI